MATTLALKNSHASSQNARIRTLHSGPLAAFTALSIIAVAACSDSVVAPEVGRGNIPIPAPAPATTPTTTPTPPSTPAPVSSGNPFLGASFYVNPNSEAKKTATSWRSTRPADAAQMDKIATQSIGTW